MIMNEKYKERDEKLSTFMEEHEITPTKVKPIAKTDDRNMSVITGTGRDGMLYTVLMTTHPDRKTDLRIVNAYWYEKQAGFIKDIPQ